jgi:hypothetical protein
VAGEPRLRYPGAQRGPRREFLLTLLAGAAGAILLLLAVRPGWARVTGPVASPLPAGATWVTGEQLIPVAGALGVASLAGLAAVIATRGAARRAAGFLLAAAGLAAAVAVSLPLSATQMLAAAREAGVPAGGSTTAGGFGGAPGRTVATVAPLLTGGARAVAEVSPWRAAAVAGAVMVLAAGLAVAWRGGRWPVLSGRYERPRPDGAADGAAALWDSLSSGLDPTEPGTGETPGQAAGGERPARESGASRA